MRLTLGEKHMGNVWSSTVIYNFDAAFVLVSQERVVSSSPFFRPTRSGISSQSIPEKSRACAHRYCSVIQSVRNSRTERTGYNDHVHFALTAGQWLMLKCGFRDTR